MRTIHNSRDLMRKAKSTYRTLKGYQNPMVFISSRTISTPSSFETMWRVFRECEWGHVWDKSRRMVLKCLLKFKMVIFASTLFITYQGCLTVKCIQWTLETSNFIEHSFWLYEPDIKYCKRFDKFWAVIIDVLIFLNGRILTKKCWLIVYEFYLQ